MVRTSLVLAVVASASAGHGSKYSEQAALLQSLRFKETSQQMSANSSMTVPLKSEVNVASDVGGMATNDDPSTPSSRPGFGNHQGNHNYSYYNHAAATLLQDVRDAETRKMPLQLFYCVLAPMVNVPQPEQDNIRKIMANNPMFTLRMLNDTACAGYVRAWGDEDFYNAYLQEHSGMIRCDVCRSAALFAEGGFYLDLDIDMPTPLLELVPAGTNFAGLHDAFNFVIFPFASAARHAILQNSLVEMRDEMLLKKDPTDFSPMGLFGVDLMRRAVKNYTDWHCPISGDSEDHLVSSLKTALGLAGARHYNDLHWTCGDDVLTLYHEENIDCHTPSAECPMERMQSKFSGTKFGIFDPGPPRQIKGWSRFVSCGAPHCGAHAQSILPEGPYRNNNECECCYVEGNTLHCRRCVRSIVDGRNTYAFGPSLDLLSCQEFQIGVSDGNLTCLDQHDIAILQRAKVIGTE